MAQVRVPAEYIKESLAKVSKKLDEAKKWAEPKAGLIPLEIPEPFNHVYIHFQPGTSSCLRAELPDECLDIAVLMGVFEAMRKKGILGSRAKKKARLHK